MGNKFTVLSFLLNLGLLWAVNIHAQETTCPPLDIYEILQDPVVQDALQDAWLDSMEGTADEHEEGGWIVQIFEDVEGDICKNYRTEIIRWPRGAGAQISSGPKPTIENGRVIADFHTHPGPVPTNDRYDNHIPSIGDLNASIANGIPGIVRYGSGIRPSTTYDLIYDGNEATEYRFSEIYRGINTHIAGFYDTRIATRRQLENADYEAQNPEWLCEEHGDIPVATREHRRIYEQSTGMTPNPKFHRDETLYFDYKVKLDFDFMRRYQFTTTAYINSGDGSLAILKENIGDIAEVFEGEVPEHDELDIHYVILDPDPELGTKMAYYGENKSDIFESEDVPLVGMSFVYEAPFFGDCFFQKFKKTSETATYKGRPYQWYVMEGTRDGEAIQMKMAMEPTNMVSDARFFHSFVGIVKDDQTKQNLLVVEYSSFGFQAKLLDIEKLSSPVAVDLSPYTIISEEDRVAGTERYKERIELTDVSREIERAQQMVEVCKKALPDHLQNNENYSICWTTIMRRVKEKYPHLIGSNPYEE